MTAMSIRKVFFVFLLMKVMSGRLNRIGTAKVAKNSDMPADKRGSHEGVYGN